MVPLKLNSRRLATVTLYRKGKRMIINADEYFARLVSLERKGWKRITESDGVDKSLLKSDAENAKVDPSEVKDTLRVYSEEEEPELPAEVLALLETPTSDTITDTDILTPTTEEEVKTSEAPKEPTASKSDLQVVMIKKGHYFIGNAEGERVYPEGDATMKKAEALAYLTE